MAPTRASGCSTRRRRSCAATAPQALTLDAVAAQAGVSKGGLLYHFRSKRELLDAMLDGFLEEFDREIAEAAEEGGSFAHGYVRRAT